MFSKTTIIAKFVLSAGKYLLPHASGDPIQHLPNAVRNGAGQGYGHSGVCAEFQRSLAKAPEALHDLEALPTTSSLEEKMDFQNLLVMSIGKKFMPLLR